MSSNDLIDDKKLKKLDRELQSIIDLIGSDNKTESEVFDRHTLLALEKLLSHKVIDTFDFPISTGKEGNVFRAITPEKKFLAIKIYRISTSTFKHISRYIIGDPRFKTIRKTRKNIIYAWTKKEFKNLMRLKKSQVLAPKPILSDKNILVMEYIGYKDKPAPLLRDIEVKNPEKMFEKIIKYMSIMYNKAQLVHGDLSAFNILVYNNKPYIIDLGQAVLREHPNAHEFLRRDIKNMVNYFNRYNIKADVEEIYNKIIK